MIEAGHRCAIPTCRTVGPLEIEHIDDWAKVREHRFENMIVLCANCHGRKGERRGQIDRKSLRRYKTNLTVLNSRYSDVERRVLEVFAMQRRQLAPTFVAVLKERLATDWVRGLSIQLPGSLRMMMMYLIQDGYVELAPPGTLYISYVGSELVIMEAMPALNGPIPDVDYYRLTSAGLDFLNAWIGTLPDDEEPDAESDAGEPTTGPQMVPKARRAN
jgi:hypothetical protein